MHSDSPAVLFAVPRAGFRHGLSQPVADAVLQFDVPSSISLALVDEWLAKSFKVTITKADDVEPPAAAIALRVMHLTAVLMRAVKAPVFGDGRVLEAQAPSSGESKWKVRVAAPKLDLLPAQMYEAALGTAARAIFWMSGRKRTTQAADELFAQLESAFVQPFQNRMASGESTIPLLRAVTELGIPFRHLVGGVFQLGWGSASVRLERGAVQFDSGIGAHMAQDKWVTSVMIRDAGLPAPVHRPAATEADALAAAKAIGWPVVVKPIDRDRGEGVTVGIDSDEKLRAAFAHALSYSKRVLVERHVAGICHRIVVANGKVVLVSRRMPKSVQGDGLHTVRQLVAQANAEQQAMPPWDRLKPFPLDTTALSCLAKAGFEADSIPPLGAWAPLRVVQSTAEGGSVEYLTDTIHPDNVDVAVHAARLFGLALAGVDMISTDITKPWHTNGAIVNEVNYSSLLPNRTSAHALPALIREFVPGDGRIPVDIALGTESSALEVAKRMQAERVNAGMNCYLVDATQTLDPEGRTIPFAADAHAAGSQTFARCMALLLDQRVDAIVIAVCNDEFLRTGLPFDRIQRLAVSSTFDAEWVAPMRALIEPYLAPDVSIESI